MRDEAAALPQWRLCAEGDAELTQILQARLVYGLGFLRRDLRL
jgi:hypothetical protein